jgi:cell division protein FtsB
MAFWGTKKGSAGAANDTASGTKVSSAPAVGRRVGVDHAIQLMRSLPTDKNISLVVTVLKTTLESLGIRVADIVQDAANRERELERRTAQLKAEIANLEKEVDQRVQEITKIEAVHTETTRVRDYLETDAIDVDKHAL